MLPFEEALAIVLSSVRPTGPEEVALADAFGRVLARPVCSDIDMPPADMSAMDGFACRKADLGRELRIVETIPAGRMPRRLVGEGECSRIMTGAVMPQGADWVVMFEETAERDGVVRVSGTAGSPNIRRRAEDVKAGERVLDAGALLGPAEIAVCASVGCDPVPVARRPLVGVIATGDELVDVKCRPSGAQIRNSNTAQVCCQITRAGCLARDLGTAADTPEATEAALRTALSSCDVVILSGGVSKGDFDCVRDVLTANGVNLLFETVRIKPGKPTVFGHREGRFVFGLPGNPVSTFVLFEMMVRPFLLACMGHAFSRRRLLVRLGGEIRRKKADRLEFIPVRFSGPDAVERISYHGSAHVHAYTRADGIIELAPQVERLAHGTLVPVVLI